MLDQPILYPILIPLAAAFIVLVLPKRLPWAKEAASLAGSGLNLIVTAFLFKSNIISSAPWSGFGIDLSFRLYPFSAFITAAASIFGFLVILYSTVSLAKKGYAKYFYVLLLLSISFLNGAALSDNLIVLLFFWEGLLITMFGMIAIGNPNAFRTATKAFIIIGITDLCMMVGIAITGHLAGTFTISTINIATGGLGSVAFLLLMTGAIAKGGSMPFHSWIPDAATDAPLPFMALLPASFEKLLGIYFLARISLDLFKLDMHSWLSMTLMIIGAVTILLAVMMALIQKEYKRLLSYHAISQVGYMILGIGTLTPAGIVGGLFHMLNNAMYKCCLFLTGGSVERQAGTTDLTKLGGLARRMPVTFACFVMTAAAISGVPPFNGFFSKELVYDGALERGVIFYLAALVGSFLTAASFLKLGHAAYLGKSNSGTQKVKEAPVAMLVPMAAIALACLLFGVWNALPIKGLILPAVAKHIKGHSFAPLSLNILLVILTVVVLIAALLNHLYGVRRTGQGVKASDHIRHAPVLEGIYDRAEKGYFDPYNIGLRFATFFSKTMFLLDKAIDWVYNVFVVGLADGLAALLKRLHTGNYSTYILWSIGVSALVVIFLMRSV